MLKAVLREGVIVPLQPLPPDWKDGDALEVGHAPPPPLDIDAWARSMQELCAASTADDEEAMRRAIREHRERAKAQAARTCMRC